MQTRSVTNKRLAEGLDASLTQPSSMAQPRIARKARQNHFRFMDLPLELRVIIYKHALDLTHFAVRIEYYGRGGFNARPDQASDLLPILFVAKVTRREALRVLTKLKLVFCSPPRATIGGIKEIWLPSLTRQLVNCKFLASLKTIKLSVRLGPLTYGLLRQQRSSLMSSGHWLPAPLPAVVPGDWIDYEAEFLTASHEIKNIGDARQYLIDSELSANYLDPIAREMNTAINELKGKCQVQVDASGTPDPAAAMQRYGFALIHGSYWGGLLTYLLYTVKPVNSSLKEGRLPLNSLEIDFRGLRACVRYQRTFTVRMLVIDQFRTLLNNSTRGHKLDRFMRGLHQLDSM